jgi:pyruvate-formate lyase-activating enzyme
MIADDEVPVVARTWHVRSDNGGGLIYKFTHDDSGFLRLTADETVAIALCDGNRQLSRIRQLLAEMLGLSQEAVAGIWNGLSKKSDKNGFLVSLADAGSGFTRPDAARLFSEVAMQVHSSQLFRHLQVPLSLLIIPTYQCRTDCVYCYAERPALSGSEYLHPQRWVELLTEAGEFGLDLLTFSGGDPLTYPDIEDLLEVAKRYQMCCLLPTKTLITRQRANRLAELIRTSDPIQISVDSFDPEIAAMLTRTPGYAAIARESIRNLIAAGARVRTNTVVTPVNLAGIESLLRELQAMGVTRAHVTNYGRSHYRHDTQLFITDAQIEELNQTVLRLQTELDWPEL